VHGLQPEKTKLDQFKTMFESEVWQRFFSKNLSDVIWLSDLELQYVYISPSAERLSGYSVEEILSLSAGDILTPSSMKKAMEIFGEELTFEETGHADADRTRILEVEQVCKDGSTVWVELNVSFVRDDGGKLIGLFGITRNIDARKKAEEALREEQKEKELILNNLAEQVAFIDPEMRIIWANSKVIERHNLYDVGYKGQICYELYHQFKEPCPDCPIVEAFKTGKTCSNVHKSPDNIYWQVTGIPVHDENGAIIGVMNTALDITELITSRQELKESESFARTIMDNLPLGLSVNSVDPEVNFTYMNDNFVKFYQTTREALSEPDAFWKVVYEDPEFRTEIKKRVEDDCASGDLARMRWENVPLTRNGQVANYINATNTPVPDKDLMISTVWDVTDQVRAEKALEENFALLRLAGETARFGGWSVNLETNECTWSEQVAMIHDKPSGYSPLVEEGIRFYAPEWREKITTVFTACAKEGIPYDEEMEIITAKGRRVWVRTVGRAVRDEQGNIVRVQGSFQDITERTLVGKALKDSEEKYRNLFEHFVAGIYLHDLNGKLIDVNPIACKQLGYLKEELLNLTVFDFHADQPDTINLTKEKIISLWKNWQHGDNYIVEAEHKRKDGTVFPVRVTTGVVKIDRDNYLLAFIQDISEQKNAEAEIKKLNEQLEERIKERTAELEAVNKELESFAYSVSHDFRAPLRALDGFSESLINNYADLLDDQGRHYLDRIHKAALYMSELIDDLLKLSRVTRTALKKEQVDLGRVAGSILAALQETEGERKVEISIAENLIVTGDPHLLHLVIKNLLDNAWKFTSTEAQVKIVVGRKTVDDEEVFFIRDNGVGFNMAYSNKLFGAFQRLHRTDEFPGTGIGLATVQRIISRHGGRIWAESEVGKGAIFYFTLPGK
jgi:PAS domain S-box-containing protein